MAIETSLDTVSAALWEGEDAAVRGKVDEVGFAERGAASRDLLPAIDRLLAARGWIVSHLDGVALTIGPGSFTGLRVGVSLVKGLAAARPVRVVAVGTLEAVAAASGQSGLVAAVVDAGRGEVYARVFNCGDGAVAPIGDEMLAPPEAWAATVPGDSRLCCVGSGAVRHADALRVAWGPRALIVSEGVMSAAAGALRLGVPRLLAGEHTPVGELLPRYLRRSTAETNWERGVVGSRRRKLLGWDPAHGRT
ncbi:MAG: tRNA (adenosine(37)-N6)-threonylcarbamoyltransferase complex dimerization subunit type 1 TsaB [Nitrospirota bacterium]